MRGTQTQALRSQLPAPAMSNTEHTIYLISAPVPPCKMRAINAHLAAWQTVGTQKQTCGKTFICI